MAEAEKVGPLDVKTSVGQQRTLEILVRVFKRAMNESNLDGSWFLHAGGLLGSVQHHDFIPWDDDADFKLHIKHRPAVQAALKKLTPGLQFHPMGIRDKLSFPPINSSRNLTANSIGAHYEAGMPWGWPFIDISYFEEYKPKRCRDYGNPRNRYNLDDIFPLTYRPLGKEWFPVPKRPINFLKSYYGIEEQICKSHSYSHIKETWATVVVERCRKLMNKYAFVHRCPIPKWETMENSIGLCDEYLVNGKGQVIHKIRLPLEDSECKSPLFTVKHEYFKCP